MKKLMIAAAAAAMSGVTFAATPAAQVYDVSLTIKTTKAAQTTIKSAKVNPYVEVDEVLVYRTQTSITWKGLIWGCNCESIDGVWENAKYTVYDKETASCDDGVACTVKGCVIWDTKGKAPVYFGNGADITDPATAAGCGWGWTFLQCIGKDAKSLECSWDICAEGDQCGLTEVFRFVGSGFGKAKYVATSYTYTETDEDGDEKVVTVSLPYSCANYVSSLSGNFAGWMAAPSVDVTTKWGCSFCGGGEDTECERAACWEWCENGAECATCGLNNSLFDKERTAAYGTWSIKYNSSLSKKLTNAYSIRDVYKFGSSLSKVAEAIEKAEKASNEFISGLKDAENALSAANKDLEAAQAVVAAAKIAYEDADAANTVAAARLAASTLCYNNPDNESYKINYAVAGYGYYQHPDTQLTNLVLRAEASEAVKETYADWQYAVTNTLVNAKSAVADAETDLDEAQEAYDKCKGKGVCE